MVVIFQLLFLFIALASLTKGYNVPQDYDSDSDWSNKIGTPDSDVIDDESYEAYESPEHVLPESEQMRRKFEDEYQLESMVFPDSDMTDDEFVEDTASVNLKMTESDTPAEIAQYMKKGYCHWEHSVWFEPEQMIRCNCFKCTCLGKGKWKCEYMDELCPYSYCGSVEYDLRKQLCCFGKVYTKKAGYNCCGDVYYNPKALKCCNNSTISSLKTNCLHHRF